MPCNKSCTIMDKCFKKYRNNLKPPCASDAVESPSTDARQSEISALINVLASSYRFDDGKRFSETIIKLRQLSAV